MTGAGSAGTSASNFTVVLYGLSGSYFPVERLRLSPSLSSVHIPSGVTPVIAGSSENLPSFIERRTLSLLREKVVWRPSTSVTPTSVISSLLFFLLRSYLTVLYTGALSTTATSAASTRARTLTISLLPFTSTTSRRIDTFVPASAGFVARTTTFAHIAPISANIA